MGPDRPNFKSYCVLDRNFTVATRPGPVRPTFRIAQKSATAKNTNFALESYDRFMKPSWVRAHGLIFGKVYIVLVCAPRYRRLSSSKRRIRGNRASNFDRMLQPFWLRFCVYSIYVTCFVYLLYIGYIFYIL